MNRTNTGTLRRNSGHYELSFSRVTSPGSFQCPTMPSARTYARAHTHTHTYTSHAILLYYCMFRVHKLVHTIPISIITFLSKQQEVCRPELPAPQHKQLYWQGHDNLLPLPHVISSLYFGSTCRKIQDDGCHSLQTCTQNSAINYCNTNDCLSLQ